MKFSGPAPEIINGRAAMVGFLASAANEFRTGATIEQQVSADPVPVAVFVLLFTYATLVPIMKGCKNEAFGEHRASHPSLPAVCSLLPPVPLSSRFCFPPLLSLHPFPTLDLFLLFASPVSTPGRFRLPSAPPVHPFAGFMTPRAETTNGRAAMLAFMVVLVLELKTGIPFF